MKLNAISGLDVTHTETEVYVEIEGKELAVLKAKQVTENGKTRVVLVPSKPRAPRGKWNAQGPVGDPLPDVTEKAERANKELFKEVTGGTTDASA